MFSGCCCRNLTPSICLLLRNFHNSLSAGVVLLRRYFALTNVVGLAPTCIVRRVFFICPLTSLRLFSLSSSITSLPVGDVLQKNREVEFIRTSLCPLTSLRLFSLSSSITSLPIGDVLQKNREVEFPLPSVFEDDVTVVTKIEKHRGIYIARNELCEGVHSENQVMRSRIYIFPFNSLSLIILARISS